MYTYEQILDELIKWPNEKFKIAANNGLFSKKALLDLSDYSNKYIDVYTDVANNICKPETIYNSDLNDIYNGRELCEYLGIAFDNYNYILVDNVNSSVNNTAVNTKFIYYALGYDYKIILKRVSDDPVAPDDAIYKVVKCNKY